MIKKFAQWYFRVESQDLVARKRGRTILKLLLLFAILNLLAGVTFVFFPEAAATAGLVIALAQSAQFAGMVLVWRGKIDEAGLLIVGMFEVIFMTHPLSSATPMDAYFTPLIPIMIAGGVLNRRWLVRLGVFNIPVILVVAYLTGLGHPEQARQLFIMGLVMTILHLLITSVHLSNVGALAEILTELTQASEVQRQEQNEELAREHTLRAEAEALARRKDRFLANMSHELRTPLNAIIGYTELILESEAALSCETQEDLECIKGASKHLVELVSGVLDLSKIQAEQMTVSWEEVELHTLIKDITRTITPLAISNENTLSVVLAASSPTVISDALKLKQILLNLLSNSLKFTHKGDVILRTMDEQEHLLIELHDTGIGMSEEQLARVFDDFVQADESTTRLYGGTGLGLALCERLTHLLGGTLTAKSRLGEGSVFSLRLPREPLPAQAHADQISV